MEIQGLNAIMPPLAMPLSSAETQRVFFSGGEDPLNNVSAGTGLPAMAESVEAGSLLVSFAVIFLGCHAMPPLRIGCSQPNHIPFYCVCGFLAVCWTNQSHNSKVWMMQDLVVKGLWCEQWGISGFCFKPHARHQEWAVFAGYDHEQTNKNR